MKPLPDSGKETIMKALPKNPKLLPWLARKAGIPLHRAEVLWRAAQRHAAHVTGATETPAYWEAAMDRLLELVAAESLREDAASFGWRRWTRLNQHVWQAPLAVLDALMLNNVRGWRLLKPMQLG
jgi:hypothetical protein